MAVVEVILVLVVIAIIVAYLVPGLGARGRTSQVSPSAAAEIESAEAYRNHLSMARWIDLQLKDDLVRSSVPADELARAKRLLNEFYGEDR
jgi:hypothetical protein